MKKLIMLSVIALGTITASASNDLFKNYYSDRFERIPPPYGDMVDFVRFDYKITVYRMPIGGGVLTPVEIRFLDCKTPDECATYVNKLSWNYFPERMIIDAAPLSECFFTIVNP